MASASHSTMRRKRRIAAWLALLACGAAAQEVPRNWFDDPFVRLSASISGCPEPLGPRMTEAQRLVASHHRAERGTTCWARGECRLPNAYAYDREIAAALVPELRASPALRDTSLWVTISGRNVYLQGCVRARAQVPALEAIARRHPDVQAVSTATRARGETRVPYEAMPAPSR